MPKHNYAKFQPPHDCDLKDYLLQCIIVLRFHNTGQTNGASHKIVRLRDLDGVFPCCRCLGAELAMLHGLRIYGSNIPSVLYFDLDDNR